MARQNSDPLSNQADEGLIRFGLPPCKTGLMLRLLRLLSLWATRFFRSRRVLLLENLAVRQQLAVLKQKQRRTWVYVLLPAVFSKFTQDPSDCTGWRLFVAARQTRGRHHHRTRLPPRLPTPRPPGGSPSSTSPQATPYPAGCIESSLTARCRFGRKPMPRRAWVRNQLQLSFLRKRRILE